jgi:hypothetical protein
MPITYHLDASTRIVHAAVEGPITQDEVRDTLRRLSADPDYHPNPRIYCDARRADFTDITYRWYLSVIGQEEVYPIFGHVTVAVVVADDFSRAMVRMYQIMTDRLSRTIRIFRDPEEATRWLLAQSSSASPSAPSPPHRFHCPGA